MATPMKLTFNGGELSPLLHSRTDIEKYSSGCQTLTNMICLSQGPTTRRVGSEFINDVKDTANKTRTIEFARNREISYILEFGENYFRIYQSGARVEITIGDLTAWSAATDYIPGDWVKVATTAYYCIKANLNNTPPNATYWVQQEIYEVWTPYTAAEAFELQFEQSADTMYLVHKDHEEHKLTTIGAADWTLAKVVWTYQALRDENIEFNQQIGIYTDSSGEPTTWVGEQNYPLGSLVVGSDTAVYEATRVISEYEDHLTDPANGGAEWSTPPAAFTSLPAGSLALLESNNFDWAATEVGKYYLLKVPREDNAISEALSALNATTTVIQAKGTLNLTTHGTWTGTIQLQKSFDNQVTWVQSRVYGSTDDRNVEIFVEEEQNNIFYRVKMTAYTSGICTVDLDVEDAFYNRLYKIVEFIDTGTVRVQLTEAETTPPVLGSIVYLTGWAQGAWGGDFGYPRALAFFEERMITASNDKFPLTVWTSKTGDYENLTSGPDDNDAIIHTINSNKVNEILWMVGSTVLLLGTSGDEWKMGASKLDDPMTPTNKKSSLQSSWGSEAIQAIQLADSVIYVQRGARKIREMAYNYQVELYESRDLSVLSEHITKSGIIDIDFQNNPYPILWVLLANGKMCGFTYEKEQQVYAWHKHETQGTYESLAVIPNGNNDELWFTCLRNDRYVERFVDQEIIDDIEDAHYVDSGLEYDGGVPVPIEVGDQTDNEPFTFDITGHGFTDGDNIRVIENTANPTEWAAFTNKNYVFTVSDVAGSVFKIKNEIDTNYWLNSLYPDNFEGMQFELVVDTLSGLTHLEGQTVNVFVDYTLHNDKVVTAGAISLDRFVNKALVGLGYTSTVRPNNIESELADGGSQARKKRIQQIDLRFYNTVGCTVLSDMAYNNEHIIPWRKAANPMDETPPLYSGDKKVKYKDGYRAMANLTITQDVPLPMTLTMIQVWLRTHNMWLLIPLFMLFFNVASASNTKRNNSLPCHTNPSEIPPQLTEGNRMKDLHGKLYVNEEDYDTIKTWAMKMGVLFPHEQALPGVGHIVVDEDGKKYGCAFLYLDNETTVSVLEWVFVNPDLNAKEKYHTMKFIIGSMEKCAIAEEHPLMFAGSNADSITRLYEKCGWSVSVRNVTHLIKNTQLKAG